MRKWPHFFSVFIPSARRNVREIVTAAPGTSLNGGMFIVPAALGNKRIHPFSDFLLHDVATGDGIVQTGIRQQRLPLSLTRQGVNEPHGQICL